LGIKHYQLRNILFGAFVIFVAKGALGSRRRGHIIAEELFLQKGD